VELVAEVQLVTRLVLMAQQTQAAVAAVLKVQMALQAVRAL
jgi:hypothetical protein